MIGPAKIVLATMIVAAIAAVGLLILLPFWP